MPDPATALSAPPEEIYALIVARTPNNRDIIRRRIDIFCRAIPERAFAKGYRSALLAIHRARARQRLPGGLPAP